MWKNIRILPEKASQFNYHFTSVFTPRSEDRSEVARIKEENIWFSAIDFDDEFIKQKLKKLKTNNALEKIQRRATKSLSKLRSLSYCWQLEKLSMPSISYRFVPGDLVETFKLSHKYYNNIGPEETFFFNTNNLQGHNFKLTQNTFNKEVGRWASSKRLIWQPPPCNGTTSPK